MAKRNILGDLTGGTIGSILSLPESMAFGALVFTAISTDLTAFGVVAGLMALGITNIIGSVTGSVRVLSTGPYALAALMLAQAVGLLSQRYGEGINEGTLILLVLTVVLLAGLFQFLFGLLAIGNLAKFIPYPVIAGLLNGIAILIIIDSIKPLLGVAKAEPYADIVLTTGNYLTLAVGLITALFIFFGDKITKKIPPPIQAIALGCGAYYAFFYFVPNIELGSTVGEIPFSIPYPWYWHGLVNIWNDPKVVRMIPQLIYLALGIAFVVSLRSLLAVVSMDNVTRERSSSNRELMGEGIANMIAAPFLSIPCSGYTGPCIANYNYGGRTRFARFTVGAFSLAVLLVLGPIVGQLPNAVLAGLLLTIGITVADRWSLGLLLGLFSKQRINKNLLFNLSLVFSVTIAMVTLGIFQGVAVGILASIISFVARMSRQPIRRSYDAHRVRSNVERILPEILLLEETGNRIQIFELDGSLFFGSTDQLAQAILESDLENKEFVILDLSRVTDIDSTGSKILLHIYDRLLLQNIKMLISGSTSARLKGNKLVNQLRKMDFFRTFDKANLFSDIASALAYAEDRILDKVGSTDRYSNEFPVEAVDVFEKMKPEEIQEILPYLERCSFSNKDTIFHQGDDGDHLLLLIRGQIELVLSATETNYQKQIAILCPGTVCGEMAVIDGKPRVATAVAIGETLCFKLTVEKLGQIRIEKPELAYKFMLGLGQDLAKRMRIANRLATELRA